MGVSPTNNIEIYMLGKKYIGIHMESSPNSGDLW